VGLFLFILNRFVVCSDSQGNNDDREKRGLSLLIVFHVAVLCLLYVSSILPRPMCVFTRNKSDVTLNYSPQFKLLETFQSSVNWTEPGGKNTFFYQYLSLILTLL